MEKEQFTPEELEAISRAMHHLEGDYPEIGDQLRLLRDSDAFKSAMEKVDGKGK